MKRIVIDRNIPFLQGVLEPFFDVVYAEKIDAALLELLDMGRHSE